MSQRDVHVIMDWQAISSKCECFVSFLFFSGMNYSTWFLAEDDRSIHLIFPLPQDTLLLAMKNWIFVNESTCGHATGRKIHACTLRTAPRWFFFTSFFFRSINIIINWIPRDGVNQLVDTMVFADQCPCWLLLYVVNQRRQVKANVKWTGPCPIQNNHFDVSFLFFTIPSF